MSSAIAWIKANVAIVALLALMVVSIPAAYVGSSMWNKRIRTARQAEATKAMTDLQSLAISYTIPGALPGQQNVTMRLSVPHPKATEFFRTRRAELEQQVSRVVEAAQQVNSQGHEVLVSGVFPRPQSRLKTIEFAEAVVGKDDRPGVYRQLLTKINAGRPPGPIELERALQDHRTRAIDAIEARTGRTEMTKEEAAELAKELATLRLGYYQQHAQQISVYANSEMLPADVPTSVGEPTVEQCFTWQFDYWLISDLLRAVDAANSIEGNRMSVDRGVVKRIEQIAIDPLVRARMSQDMYGEPAPPPRNPITGRRGGTDSLYDVRNATMTVIVASSRLPEFIDAISRTNFMTVIGVDLDDVDVWGDLEQGYFYGSDHVVRARLRIETVWLRNWTTPLMPARIRQQLTGSDGEESLEGGAG